MNAAANTQQNLNPPFVGIQPPILMSALSQRNNDRQIIHPTLVEPVKKMVHTTPNFDKYTSTSTEPTTGKDENNGTDPKPIGILKPEKISCSIL